MIRAVANRAARYAYWTFSLGLRIVLGLITQWQSRAYRRTAG